MFLLSFKSKDYRFSIFLKKKNKFLFKNSWSLTFEKVLNIKKCFETKFTMAVLEQMRIHLSVLLLIFNRLTYIKKTNYNE